MVIFYKMYQNQKKEPSMKKVIFGSLLVISSLVASGGAVYEAQCIIPFKTINAH